MDFPLTAYVYLFFLFFGAAAGSELCIVFGKILRRKYFRFRLSLFFLLLSVAVVFAVLLLLNCNSAEKNGFSINEIPVYIKENYLFCLFYFTGGLLCTVFIRTLLPLAAVCYTVLTFAMGLSLYKKMPLPEEISVTVNEPGQLCFKVFRLNDKAIFPLPHVWYSFEGTGTDRPDTGGSAFEINENDSFIAKTFYSLCNKIAGKSYLECLEVPPQEIYPALFNIKIKSGSPYFSAALEKLM